MADRELEKIKEHFDAVISDNKREMLADNGEIKLEIKTLHDKIDRLKEVMNGRIKKLEIKQARREGAESVSQTTQINWTKIVIGLITIIGGAIGLATLLAQALTKGSI